MALPAPLQAVFQAIDTAATVVDFSALLMQVTQVAHASRASLDTDGQRALAAEMFLLNLWPQARARGSAWGLYYAPVHALDGRPELSEVTDHYISYWIQRSTQKLSPALVARYADAAWEFGSKVPGLARPAVQVAQRAIDAQLLCAGGRGSPSDRVVACERAMQLATSLRDTHRQERAKEQYALIASAAASHPALVNRMLLTILSYRDRLTFDATMVAELVARQDSSLAELDVSPPMVPNVPQLKANVEVLRDYHRATGNEVAAREAVDRFAVGVLRAATGVAASLATAWLSDSVQLCSDLGMTSRVQELTLALESANTRASDEMQSFTTTMTITREEREKLADECTAGGLGVSLGRFVRGFWCTKAVAAAEIGKAARESPLLHLFATSVTDGKHVRARVGGILDDHEGHLLRHLSERLTFSAPFLRICLRAIIDRYDLWGASFVGILRNSGAFDESRSVIMGLGFDRYVQGDYVSSLHLLVPQVEHLLRGVLRIEGDSQSVRRQDETYEEKQLGGLLAHATVQRVLSEDGTWYLQGLLSDARCWNLRNDVCHGLLTSEECTRTRCEWTIHAILLIVYRTLPPDDSPASGEATCSAPSADSPEGGTS